VRGYGHHGSELQKDGQMRDSRRTYVAAGAFWIAAAVVYLVAEAVTAAAFPGYSYATNYISDLGVPEVGTFQGRVINSPRHLLMNTAFVLSGILFLIAALLAVRASTSGPRKTFTVLSAIYAVGISLVGLFHGSQESADNGLAILHVGGAGMAIIGGNLAVVTAGIAARRLSGGSLYMTACIALGAFGLASLVMLQIDAGSSAVNILPEGIWERFAVYTVTVWQLLTGVALLARRHPRERARLA
jgi:hypothetical membrane protein